MDKENRAVLLIAVLIFILVCVFTNVCEAQPALDRGEVLDSVVWWLCRELDRVESQLSMMNASLSETREELAEMRGRQNVTTGVAAGTPTGLAGLLFWWLRREKRKKNGK